MMFRLLFCFLLSFSKDLKKFWMQDSVRHFDLCVHKSGGAFTHHHMAFADEPH